MINNKYRSYLAILGFLLLGFFVWYFWNIVIYIIIAAVLSIIGRPLVKRITRIKIWKFGISRSLASFFTLVLMLGLLVGFIWFFVPLISNQAKVISNIDIDETLNHFRGAINSIQNFLIETNIIQEGQTIEAALKAQVESVISMTTFSNLFSNILSATGSFLMGVFSVLFITFFFLQDENMLENIVILIAPKKQEEKIKHIMQKTRSLLSKYFIGLLGEVLTMITLLTIGLTIIGVKNALFIGFFGGLLNIIPYLGPLIGGSIAVVFGITTSLSLGMYDQILWLSLGIIAVWLISNAIDNVFYQPFIYSSVVKARPLEIFLVIIMAGSLAGIPGMILAIPSYTVLRIIAKEFLGDMKFVKKLTERI